MKKIITGSVLFVALLSCSKNKIKAPADFTVTTGQSSYSVRDTVVFNFTGNPDYIIFYSGEVHSKYQYASVSRMAADSNLLNFSTTTTAPGAATQPVGVNNVSLLYSTNFSGIYDSANIRKASWTDISSRGKFATTTATVASGNIHIEDLKPASDSTPLYFAFKYVSDTAKTNYLSRQWVLNAVGLKSYFKDTVYALAANFTSGGFYAVNVLNNINTWAYTNTSSITTSLSFKAPALASLPDEDWVISRAFNLSLYPSDLGTQIKNLSDTRLSSYKMTRPFRTAGTYTITFVGMNRDSEHAEQVIKQLTLTITP